MISREQNASFLIGSADTIASLAQKDSASLLVIGDSHGAEHIVQLVVRECGKTSDALLFCGDGISDICALLQQAREDASFAAFLPPVIALVEGNNDVDLYTLSSPNTQLRIPLTQTLTVCGHTLFLTHGHRFSLCGGTQYLAQAAVKSGADIAIYGHTHIARAESEHGITTLNPGSCALPRGGQPPSYARLTVTRQPSGFECDFYKITGAQSVPFIPQRSSYW